jgi:guanylate kinase/ActR/RegA family two-component response regulator
MSAIKKWNVLVVGNGSDERVLGNALDVRGYDSTFIRGSDLGRASGGLEEAVLETKADAVVAFESVLGSEPDTENFLKFTKTYFSDNFGSYPSRTVIIGDSEKEEDEGKERDRQAKLVKKANTYMTRGQILSYVDAAEDLETNSVINALDMAKYRVGKKKTEIGKSNRILIIEDDELQCGYYQMLFDNSPYEVEIARTLNRAIAHMRSSEFGLVILDKNLADGPQMDVHDLSVRLDSTYPFIQQILISGATKPEDLNHFDTNALTKPVEDKDLFKRIKNNFKAREKKIADIVESSRGKLWLVGGHRAAGKTTVNDQVYLALPFVDKSLTEVSRNPRPGEVYGKDHIFRTYEELEAKMKDPDWLIYKHFNNDGAPYLVGINLAEISSSLESGKDVVLTLVNPNMAEFFYKRYGSLVESVIIYNPDFEEASALAGKRDAKEYSAEKVKMDLERFKAFKNPKIYSNQLDPFSKKEEGIIYKNAFDIFKMGYLDQVVRKFTNEIQMQRVHKKDMYSHILKMGY